MIRISQPDSAPGAKRYYATADNYKVGANEIVLRRTTPRAMAAAGRMSGLVIRWVMVAARDFAKDGDGIVSKIEIRQVKRERIIEGEETKESESA